MLVIAPDGVQVGVLELKKAIIVAEELGLDLVEVSPESKPPVARLMDYGKYKYELSQKAKESRKNQVKISVKEVQLKPKIDTNDYNIKLNQSRKFLKDGDKVNFDRDKIAKSVELALRKRPVDTDTKEKLISRIVNDIEGMGENEISSNVVGEAVMKALFTIDKVAYVRFASVYRDFRETKDFEQFLGTIDKK